jgi:ribosomal protein L13
LLAVAVVAEQGTDRKTIADPMAAWRTVDAQDLFHGRLQSSAQKFLAIKI